MNQDKKLVFGYVRVSTENQLENYSIEEQTERLQSYCAAKQWELKKIYTDGGFSGGSLNRPALKQMLADMIMNQIDIILVYKLDRISRCQKDTLTLIEDHFLKNNIDFVSINENFDTSSPFGKAMIGILSVFAQLEKDQITERFTMGRIGRCKAGYFHGGGFSPFGYDYSNGVLRINEIQCIIVKEIYDLFLSGKSIHAIWHEMEHRYEGNWTANKIKLILTNTIYIGKVKFSQMEFMGKHTPIISAEQFQAVQNLLHSKQQCRPTASPQKTPFRAGYLLSSLITCGKCNAKYSANHGFYKCYSRSKCCKKYITDPNCKNKAWRIDELDQYIFRSIQEVLASTTILAAIQKKLSSTIGADDDFQKRMRKIESEMERLIALYQIEEIPLALVTKKINQLRIEKKILEHRSNSVLNANKTQENLALQSENTMINFLDCLSLESKRILVSSLIKGIIINGSAIIVQWRI